MNHEHKLRTRFVIVELFNADELFRRKRQEKT